ncbi:hypothetical protein DY218_27240 [Streptomyces triticagri]|uniref:PKD domain-containing protein n=1 Tax=Streptomyces triticagri TaxID=2293568 RepID=A0A372LZC4_9ACTN|nr:PKD domain-containing protein [Streptomyces triticagri]RFU83605.1 hypothetical protein DY218_27240 [Streptomyces triticagri]
MATTYTVTATSGEETDTVDVTVPAAAPVVDIVMDDTDTTGMTAKLTVVSNSGDGPVTVDWGDSTTVIDPVEVGATITHKYATAGTYTVKTTSKADTTAFDETDVSVPFNIDLEITAVQDDDNPALFHFTIIGADEPTTTVDFGDGSQAATVQTPAGTGTVDHTYARV